MTESRSPSGDGTPPSGQRVLVVEDDEMVRLLVREAIESGGRQVEAVETVADARSAIAEADFDVVVLDLFLPDGDGRELLAEIRERRRSAQVQVLVLSGKTSRETKLECFRRGADEFLEKPVDPQLLQAAVDRQLERARTRSTQSRVDPLTGLPNRPALVDRYSDLMALGARSHAPLSVALLEMDGLDRLRDRHGREVADDVQAGFAGVLSRALEEPDFAGRWGDATFVVLLPGTTAEEAKETLRGVFADLRALGYSHSSDPSEPADPSDPPDPSDPSDSSDTPSLPPDPRDGPRHALPVHAGVIDGRRHDDLSSAVRDAEEALALAHGRHEDGGIAVHPKDADGEVDETLEVLLIEDEPVIAQLVGHRLRREGMTVVHLESGTEVHDHMEELDAPPYDVILCDVKLPGFDGFELLQQFRANPSWSQVPVVMVTSMGREADVVRAFELGADDYVLKPVSPGELIARIRRLLRRR